MMYQVVHYQKHIWFSVFKSDKAGKLFSLEIKDPRSHRYIENIFLRLNKYSGTPEYVAQRRKSVTNKPFHKHKQPHRPANIMMFSKDLPIFIGGHSVMLCLWLLLWLFCDCFFRCGRHRRRAALRVLGAKETNISSHRNVAAQRSGFPLVLLI